MYENMTKEELVNELKKMQNKNPYGLTFESDKIKEKVLIEMENKYPILNLNKELKIAGNYRENYLIDGDNLHALTCLQATHKNKIDVVYIDPPYNTEKEDFIYNDKIINEDDSYRHSKWLNFMDKRLKLAKNLICEDGIIAINIDENEFSQLKLLCDNIFGEKNRLSTHYLQVRYSQKSLNESGDFQDLIEMLLIYAKDKKLFNANKPKEKYKSDKFIFDIKFKKADEVFLDEKGNAIEVFKKGSYIFSKEKKPNINSLYKETYISGSIYSDTGYGKSYQKYIEPRHNVDGYGTIYKMHGRGEDGNNYRVIMNPKSEKYTKGIMYTMIPIKTKEKIENGVMDKTKPIINFYDFSPDFGNIRREGGVAYNKGKKPIKLIKQILNYHTNKNITVLDFFAGSGSTGHAVLDLNKEDGGNRNFILCQKTENETDVTKDITYQRFLNIREKYDFKLNYLTTNFVNKKDKRSTIKSMSKKCLTILQLENDTFEEVFNDGFSYVFSGVEKTIGVCIMDNSFDIDNINLECFKDCDTIYYYKLFILKDKISNIYKNKKLVEIPENIMKILEGAL